MSNFLAKLLLNEIREEISEILNHIYLFVIFHFITAFTIIWDLRYYNSFSFFLFLPTWNFLFFFLFLPNWIDTQVQLSDSSVSDEEEPPAKVVQEQEPEEEGFDPFSDKWHETGQKVSDLTYVKIYSNHQGDFSESEDDTGESHCADLHYTNTMLEVAIERGP